LAQFCGVPQGRSWSAFGQTRLGPFVDGDRLGVDALRLRTSPRSWSASTPTSTD